MAVKKAIEYGNYNIDAPIYFCDTDADKSDIPDNEINLGTIAYIIADAKWYMANSLKEWVQQ